MRSKQREAQPNTAQRAYVHGYSERELIRLYDQANTLAPLLHRDTVYPSGSAVLEVGCGVGAQTVHLARNSPEAQFTAIDISETALLKARALLEDAELPNVRLLQADLFALPFSSDRFDHIFICFVLEHLQEPLAALACLKRVLKPGGSITVIEGDHGSAYFYPRSDAALHTIRCLIEIQARLNGNALIGRALFPLLTWAGFTNVQVDPRMVYVDSSKPHLVAGFTRNTFIAMVAGVRDQALTANLIDAETWTRGIVDLYRTTERDGTFCYTFFKATAVK
ncbi:MAG TPA: methyltransferase domain-containing protein [Methanomicrobia archaeon]|nr:methyltransferase domain-containing protein [Methanomicrobia archaeon]